MAPTRADLAGQRLGHVDHGQVRVAGADAVAVGVGHNHAPAVVNERQPKREQRHRRPGDQRMPGIAGHLARLRTPPGRARGGGRPAYLPSGEARTRADPRPALASCFTTERSRLGHALSMSTTASVPCRRVQVYLRACSPHTGSGRPGTRPCRSASQRMGIIPTKSAGLKPWVSALYRLNTATFPLFCMATKANLPSGDGTTCSANVPSGAGQRPDRDGQPGLVVADPEHRQPAAAGDQQVLPVVGQRLAFRIRRRGTC